jgi:hypothetical protein
VCRPKNKGGLGIINFEVQNQALLLKQLHKFYWWAEVPWVKLVWSLYSSDIAPHAQSRRGSFWWHDVFNLVDTYRSITLSKIGDAMSTLFWKDFWHFDKLLCEQFPRLFSQKQPFSYLLCLFLSRPMMNSFMCRRLFRNWILTKIKLMSDTLVGEVNNTPPRAFISFCLERSLKIGL